MSNFVSGKLSCNVCLRISDLGRCISFIFLLPLIQGIVLESLLSLIPFMYIYVQVHMCLCFCVYFNMNYVSTSVWLFTLCLWSSVIVIINHCDNYYCYCCQNYFDLLLWVPMFWSIKYMLNNFIPCGGKYFSI